MAVKSIKDIARLSGFSISTVSRVLNNSGRFSKTTQEKILKITKEENYTQNVIAKGMRKGSLSIIGILVPDITNPYYASIVKKCEQYFFKAGYLTIVCNTERSSDLEQKYIAKLENHMVDGLVVVSTQTQSTFNSDTIKLPTVFIDRFPTLSSNNISVSSDNYAGAVLATNHLIDRNSYPIMITTKDNSFSSNQKRIQGFKDTLINRKIADQTILTLKNNSDQIYLEKDKIINKIKELLKRHKKIGIFAINDNVASYLYQAALEANIKIPEQLSIVGFDDSPIAHKLELSTIRQDTNKIAEVSGKHLLELLKNDNILEHKFTIPITLIQRKTS
jgi:transcriptional regulator